MLTDLSPVTALGLGILVGAGVMLPIVFLFRRLSRDAETEQERLEAVAVKAREILAGAPDGLFLWDRGSGSTTCSRKLARLLTLADGTNAPFEQVVQCFETEAQPRLKEAVASLHQSGQVFDLVLPLEGAGGRSLIQAVGARAATKSGKALADMVWFRDVSTAAKMLVDLSGETDLPEARDLHIRSLLDALPFPVWLRSQELGIEFTNQAALSKRVAGPDDGQAAEALTGGRAVSRTVDVENAGETSAFDVTECPLGENGVAGLIGYAFPHHGDGEPAPDPVPAAPPVPTEPDAGRSSSSDKVLDRLTTAIALYDGDTRLVYFNPAFADVWRLDASWLNDGPAFGDVLERLRADRSLPEVPDFRAYKMEQLQMFQDQTDSLGDLMHLPDGRTLRADVHPLAGGGLGFSFEDVTDQLDLERSVNAQNAVQRATLDNLYEAIAVFGSDGRLKLSNPAFLTLWKLDAKALKTELHVADFVEATRPLAATGENWDSQKARILASMTSREIHRGRVERNDDRVLEFANVPLPDGAVLISYLDVTDDARVEEALQERARAFEDANRLKSTFIASMSEELREPLTSITGFAELLAARQFGDLSPRQEEYVTSILGTSRHLAEVVGNVLELAAIEAEQVALAVEPCNLQALLNEVYAMAEGRAQQKSLTYEFQMQPSTEMVHADPRRLKQAVYNLLDNAINVTPERGTVVLMASVDEGAVEIAVSDTGPGIATSDRETVFQPFSRSAVAHPEGGAGSMPPGAGLGLPIVRSFMRMHGGDVDIRSRQGRGTTVICRFPVALPALPST